MTEIHGSAGAAGGAAPGSRLPAEAILLHRLRAGDESAFAQLIRIHSPSLLRVAMIYVGSRAVAEEVVQETWLGVLDGLDRFEGRSSLKTWIFRILVNTAITKATRERRNVPFSELAAGEWQPGELSVEPERFLTGDHAHQPYHWAVAPGRWKTPEEGLLAAEVRGVILRTIRDLPPARRTVMTLRDIEGWPSHEVCDALGISEGNQRVLLHRARTAVRSALERYFEGTGNA